MKIESKYNKMPLQTMSKRVWSSFIDGLLLLIWGVFITLTLGFSLLKGNETFVKYNTQCFENIEQMHKLQSETKLQKTTDKIGTNVLAPADYFDIYINKQIRLSYINFTSDFNNAGIYLEVKEGEYSTLNNDELAYYFTNYKIEHNINTDDFSNKSALTYFKEEILFKNINQEYYIDQVDSLPILKSETAITLYKHYSDIEYNKDLYYEFSDAVIAIRNIGLQDLSTYDLFNQYYVLYEEAYNMMAKYENITLCLSFALAFLIFIFLPNMLTKDGITLGSLFTNTRFIHEEDYKIGKLRTLMISMLSFVKNFFIIILISLFTFGFENLTCTVFNIGDIKINFLHLILLSFVVTIANFAMSAILYDHRSLVEVITNTKQVDIKTYIEPKKK